jgi:uncharacterized protein YcbK (DUF882 family)
MTNYKIGRIYRIELLDNPNIRYIGSTFNRLSDRFRQHKDDYNKWLNNKHDNIAIYPYFKQYNINNFKIILIKEYEVVDRIHLESKEQLHMNKLKCINTNSSFRISYLSNKKYREENINKIKECKKNYYQNNKDKICEKTKNYNKLNKDKIAEKAKEYYSNNKENINNYKKEWYENKKKEKSKKINCECGSIVAQYSLNKHLESKKHKKHLKSIK